jgi:hypothetical protein
MPGEIHGGISISGILMLDISILVISIGVQPPASAVEA